ncbi:MAG: hypothetical protein WCL44_13485, partial [bacterium]
MAVPEDLENHSGSSFRLGVPGTERWCLVHAVGLQLLRSRDGMQETLWHAHAICRYMHIPGKPLVMEECGWY